VLSQSEIRAGITNKLIEVLKSGKHIPWRKPWRGIDGPRLPTNFVTGRPYSGWNVMALWLAAQERGYSLDWWASYQQWRSKGANVKRGEKATQIIFWRPVSKLVKGKDGDETEKTFPILRTWSIFNIAQVEGKIVEQLQQEPALLKFDQSDRGELDRAIAATGADIRLGSKAVYYRPPQDYVEMPEEGRFLSFPGYAETLLHEVGGHWTESRLGWLGSYAEGELRAEIASCFLTAALGIPDSCELTNHASYLASWLEALENDHRFIFRASSAASKAAEFFLSFSRPQTEAENNIGAEAVAD